MKDNSLLFFILRHFLRDGFRTDGETESSTTRISTRISAGKVDTIDSRTDRMERKGLIRMLQRPMCFYSLGKDWPLARLYHFEDFQGLECLRIRQSS